MHCGLASAEVVNAVVSNPRRPYDCRHIVFSSDLLLKDVPRCEIYTDIPAQRTANSRRRISTISGPAQRTKCPHDVHDSLIVQGRLPDRGTEGASQERAAR